MGRRGDGVKGEFVREWDSRKVGGEEKGEEKLGREGGRRLEVRKENGDYEGRNVGREREGRRVS